MASASERGGERRDAAYLRYRPLPFAHAFSFAWFEGSHSVMTRSAAPVRIRIGQGFDVHAFGDGDHVMLGGVRVPHDRSVLAHSDGDVAIHALCDAMLGALALGDIGRHFPPSDPQWAGADSRAFLRHCLRLIGQAGGWRVGNVDITVICERPKVGPHAEAMRAALADDLQVELGAVSVKATTTERLGFAGRGEGIAAQAVVLLVRE